MRGAGSRDGGPACHFWALEAALRVRAKLLVLFILMGVFDAGGKLVERHPPTLDRLQRVATRLGVRARVGSRRSANNFEIFRGSSRHLIADTDLYASYPAEFLYYVNAPIGLGKAVPGALKPHIACPTTCSFTSAGQIIWSSALNARRTCGPGSL